MPSSHEWLERVSHAITSFGGSFMPSSRLELMAYLHNSPDRLRAILPEIIARNLPAQHLIGKSIYISTPRSRMLLEAFKMKRKKRK